MGQDDHAIAQWLALLRDGTPEQQALARTELGLLLERRGQLDDAAEAYWTNVTAQVRDPRPYFHLAAILRLRGDDVVAARVLAPLPAMDPAVEPISIESRRNAQGKPPSRGRAKRVVLGLSVLSTGLATLLVSVLLVDFLFTGRTAASCADVAQRFPIWLDPEHAVLKAMSPTGREAPLGYARLRLGFDTSYDTFPIPADETVASWIMTSLYSDHFKQPVHALDGTPGTLPIHVSLQTSWRRQLLRGGNANAMPALRPMVSRREWEALRSLPDTTCPGSLLSHPANARLVRLMTATVGNTTWRH